MNSNRDPSHTHEPAIDEDQQLWSHLASMWSAYDPVPDDLVEQVLVAVATEDLDAEYELLHLVSRSAQLAGARSAGDALTLSFSSDAFSLLLRVSTTDGDYRRVDGWVTPAQEMRVSVKQQGRTVDAEVDQDGRFEIPRLVGGPSRFWLAAHGDAASAESPGLFATPTFEL
jgi:hypothetical protein